MTDQCPCRPCTCTPECACAATKGGCACGPDCRCAKCDCPPKKA